jgi:hypothetical protein
MAPPPAAASTVEAPVSAEDALGAADVLEAEGLHLAAIELLTRCNRRQRDIALEERLVRLRHRAFTVLDADAGPASWPPEVPDLFAGVSGPPEIRAAELSAQTLAAGILHHGCLLVRGLLPPDKVDLLIGDIDEAFAVSAPTEDGAAPPAVPPWFIPFAPDKPYSIGMARSWVREGGGVYTVDSPPALFDVLEVFDEVGVRGAIEGYLGERPVLSVKKWTLRRVPLTSGTDWHQDGAFIGDEVRSVNVWLALTDCGVDAASLDIVPRRLGLVETGTEGAQFDWSVGPGVVERVAGDAGVVRPVFAAGDALLFDHRFLHRTGVSPGMTKERYAIESWFFAPTDYPGPQIPIAY